jgi:hypothetical protein
MATLSINIEEFLERVKDGAFALGLGLGFGFGLGLWVWRGLGRLALGPLVWPKIFLVRAWLVVLGQGSWGRGLFLGKI